MPSLCMLAKPLQTCPNLCETMNCSLPRLLCPWDFPPKNTGVGSLGPPPGDIPNSGIEPMSLRSNLHCQEDSLPLAPFGDSQLTIAYLQRGLSQCFGLMFFNLMPIIFVQSYIYINNIYNKYINDVYLYNVICILYIVYILYIYKYIYIYMCIYY